jgi:hypothetical protein
VIRFLFKMGSGKYDPVQDIKIVGGVILLIIVAWFFMGGPEKLAARSGERREPPQQIATTPEERVQVLAMRLESLYEGDFLYSRPDLTPYERERELESAILRTEKELEDALQDLKKAEEIARRSTFHGMVSIEKVGTPRGSDPQGEYVRIRADRRNRDRVDITGWQLYSPITGTMAIIGTASTIPVPRKSTGQESILLEPGQRAFITSSKSPIGTSFQTNLCTGYFEQSYSFTPALNKQCPRPREMDLPQRTVQNPRGLDDACLDHLERRNTRCLTPEMAPELTARCRSYINANFTYTGCLNQNVGSVSLTKNSEWRIYLGSGLRLWKDKREEIELLDAQGKLVDVFNY